MLYFLRSGKYTTLIEAESQKKAFCRFFNKYCKKPGSMVEIRNLDDATSLSYFYDTNTLAKKYLK